MSMIDDDDDDDDDDLPDGGYDDYDDVNIWHLCLRTDRHTHAQSWKSAQVAHTRDHLILVLTGTVPRALVASACEEGLRNPR